MVEANVDAPLQVQHLAHGFVDPPSVGLPVLEKGDTLLVGHRSCFPGHAHTPVLMSTLLGNTLAPTVRFPVTPYYLPTRLTVFPCFLSHIRFCTTSILDHGPGDIGVCACFYDRLMDAGHRQ